EAVVEERDCGADGVVLGLLRVLSGVRSVLAGGVLPGTGLHSLPSMGGQEIAQGGVADRADQVDEGAGEDSMAGGDGVGCGGQQDGETDPFHGYFRPSGQGVVAGADQSLVDGEQGVDLLIEAIDAAGA